MEIGAWASALRTSALVGTSRRAPAHAPAGLGTPPADTELLLDQAALFDVLSRGGARAVQGRQTDPAPPETRPYAPQEAQRLLGLLLHQSPVKGELRDDLILGWLLACAEHNAIVGPALLPELAALALRDVSLRQPLSNCWGERGRWLASIFHPRLTASTVASRDALGEEVPPEEIEGLVRSWPTLDRAAASIELRRLRNTDADRARELLATHWAKLPAKARDEHLDVLGENLTLADEDFLEAALDDRAQAVRGSAAALLGRLPGSGLRARMGDRLAPLIQVEKRMLRPTKISLSLPQGVDEAGVRDGLAAPDPTVTGQAPYWLRAIIRSSPLDVWVRVSGMVPRDVVQALDLPLRSGTPSTWRSVARATASGQTPSLEKPEAQTSSRRCPRPYARGGSPTTSVATSRRPGSSPMPSDNCPDPGRPTSRSGCSGGWATLRTGPGSSSCSTGY